MFQMINEGYNVPSFFSSKQNTNGNKTKQKISLGGCLEREAGSCERSPRDWPTSLYSSSPRATPGASRARGTCCYGPRVRREGSGPGILRLLRTDQDQCEFGEIFIEMQNL